MPCQIHSNHKQCMVAFRQRRLYKEGDCECPLLGLKTLIVTCRRSKGKIPDPIKEKFLSHWDEHEKWFLENLNTRWLISVCDTLCDISPRDTQAIPLLISLLVTYERFAQTLYRQAYRGHPEHKNADPDREKLWDGTIELSMGPRADAHTHLFERLDRALKSDRRAYAIFRVLFKRMTKDPNNTLSRLDRYAKRQLRNDILRTIA